MKPMTLEGLTEVVDGQLFADPKSEITGFSLDHRTVKPGDLFLAVRGNRVDGHEFVNQAFKAGATACLVERAIDGPHVLVHNLVIALARLGSHFRSTFHGPVVAVTGSAGKTMTKEFIAAALSPMGAVLKTEGNRNTEYSAPLLWTEIQPDHKAVVVEMAMRGMGQISHLASFSKPTVGVVTNVGLSHIDLVGTKDAVARAKAELPEALPTDGLAVLWREEPYFDFLKSRANCPVKSFGFGERADCRVIEYEAKTWSGCVVSGSVSGHAWRAEIPTVGRHIALNIACAVLVAAELGVDPQSAAEAMKEASLPPMRMQTLDLNGATVVLDAYNASPSSTLAAIETLAELPCEGLRLAVIAEMKELGTHSAEAHRIVGEALVKHRIDGAIFLGEGTVHCFEACKALEATMANGLEDVTKFLEKLQPGDVVLIKGSRAMELEKALEPLLGAFR